MTQPLLILGTRTRPAADSARRAGYEPIEVALTENQGEVLRQLDATPRGIDVLLANGCENVPGVVEAAAFERRLISPEPAAMRQVRDPRKLAALPRIAGLGFCAVRTGAGGWFGDLMFKLRHRGGFLLKPLAGTDGQGITAWDRGPIPDEHYVQQAIAGKPLGAVFFADGWSCVLVGVTEQLVGEPFAGARRFQYGGSIYPFELDESQRAAITRFAVALVQRHDLRGLFGVDLILDADDVLWPVEINPRYTDAVEVIERSDSIHALRGRAGRVRETGERVTHHGKLLVRARGRVSHGVADTLEKLAKLQWADAPPADRALNPGDLIATIYATASTRAGCVAQLRELAGRVYAACGDVAPVTPSSDGLARPA